MPSIELMVYCIKVNFSPVTVPPPWFALSLSEFFPLAYFSESHEPRGDTL